MFKNMMQNCAKPGVAPGSGLIFWSMGVFHKPAYRFTLDCFDLPVNGRVLDIGCGGGDLIRLMSERARQSSFYGVDYSPLSVRRTLQRNRKGVAEGLVHAVEASVSHLPFENDFFDAATATATIYFWPDPANDIREIVRTLKPGGVLAICVEANDAVAAKKYTEMIDGMKVYTADEVVAFFTGAGLTDVQIHREPVRSKGKTHAAAAVCITGKKPGQTDRVPCGIGGVPETMLIPLWAKAAESRRPDGILQDPAATEILEKLDYDFGKFAKSKLSQVGCALRTVLIDNALKAFLARHPGAVVVNLGAGLDTRPKRLAAENFSRWIDLDVPEAIALRQRFFSGDPRMESIGKSLLDLSWMEDVRPAGHPVVFIAEGLFMYFSEAELRPLFNALAEKFPGGEMLYELISPMAVNRQNIHDSVGKLDGKPAFRWSMLRAADIEQWNPAIHFLNEWNYFDFHPERWGFFGKIARCPLFRKKFACRIAHIRFANRKAK